MAWNIVIRNYGDGGRGTLTQAGSKLLKFFLKDKTR